MITASIKTIANEVIVIIRRYNKTPVLDFTKRIVVFIMD